MHTAPAVNNKPLARSLVVNWTSQRLNQLALAPARQGDLARLVRPYVNQGRAWERALARLPLAGRWVAGSFGRRQLIDPALHARVIEAGVVPDLLAAMPPRPAMWWSVKVSRWKPFRRCASGAGRTVLSYPVAHHRHRRQRIHGARCA